MVRATSSHQQGDTKKSISSKANGSSDFNKLVSAASDYTRSTGESINFLSSNYFLSQPRDGSGSDGVGNVHAAGISAMFESKKQTYLNRSDGNTWTNRMNSFLDNIIRTTKGLNGGK